ncbi:MULTISPECIES: phage tail assembly protein [Paenibacillus]|uniref:phage tail assembly protein n=1 Tax=Paenibacillus TaxID=44249 RepID=UPI0011A33B4D|nr:phage tail assembly protein [Paenibacillus sp. IHBB 10380]
MSGKAMDAEQVTAIDENMEEVKPAGRVIKLSRPVNWEDKEYNVLTLDFDGLSGDDMIAIESEFMSFIKGMKGILVAFKTDHPAYLTVVAAKAAGVDPFMLKKLSARDFLKVTGVAKDFLNGYA